MILKTVNHKYHYEMENVIRLFYPFVKLKVVADTTDESDDDFIVLTKLEKDESKTKIFVKINNIEQYEFVANDHCDYANECERVMAVLLYNILCKMTGAGNKWGILTGVRPGKLMRSLSVGHDIEFAKRYFIEKLLVSEEKADLCATACINEDKIIARSPRRSFSLYISIPFCPSRCSYCSFVSHSVERSFGLIEDYVNLLCREIKQTGDIAKRLSLKLCTVYIGGGTPTVLSELQLRQILDAVSSNFDLSECMEYTVEAGRPDTITEQKLNTLREGGVTRISINPQTLNDRVLEEIGRRHTAQQTIEAFEQARKCGFDNINMDLIAGLPLDTPESFEKTLNRILELDPESITIHTLAMKRSSSMTADGTIPDRTAGEYADRMLTFARKALSDRDYYPYYLYRQSKSAGNLENTGFCKQFYEGLYNIYIMDETHTILACGASAVTKLKSENGYIERIFNFKYPYEYIGRFEEMISRKQGVERFYAEHC